MSESDAQTPKSAKRRQEGKKVVYTSRKKQILDRVPQELRISRIIPITRRIGPPNRKSQNHAQWIHDIDGTGDQIRSILEGEIMRLQIATVEVAKTANGWFPRRNGVATWEVCRFYI